MRGGNLQAAGGRMQEALEELRLAWNVTREHWQDQQAAHFEQKYLRQINEDLIAAFPAINQMSQTLGAASRDCTE
ncbi:hypothetical protein SH661x_003632 [Planctomicrobium sp. SH661]|uniref:hypothetical protein n=1 Tax=Planctomicrobium sp. SH661 TaxID=3448124 RepID=UPI003F5B70DA